MIKKIIYCLLLLASIYFHALYLHKAHQFPKQYLFRQANARVKVIKITNDKNNIVGFIAKLHRICIVDNCQRMNKKIQLNVYYSFKRIRPGEVWDFRIKLKPWHGYANIGSYNSELWAYLNGLAAKGYVIKPSSAKRVEKTPLFDINFLRNHLRQKILAHTKNNFTEGAVIIALVLGDKSKMSYELRELLQRTGTSHLLAISGLHIGLISGFIYCLFFLFWRISSRLCLWLPAKKAAIICSLLSAIFYAAITGFQAPAFRAMIMLGLISFALIFDKKVLTFKIFIFTLLLSLLISPFELFNISFWLSYLAVFFIIFAIGYRFKFHKIWAFLKVQICITVGLMPVLFFYFGQSSIIGILTNIIAIPMVSFFILPLSFLASLLPLSLLSQFLFELDSNFINYLITFLQFSLELPFDSLNLGIANLWIVGLAMLGILILFLPKMLRLNAMSLFLFLPLLFYKPIHVKQKTFHVTTLDVGQGLSIVIHTAHHSLVYDLGPGFTSGSSATRSVVIPYLQSQKVYQVDKVIISHQDSDHVGDIDLFMRYYPNTRLLSSAVTKLKKYPVNYCIVGQQWRWDGVDFMILAPFKKAKIGDNHQSCVLKVTNGKHSILLTGDIASKDEEKLIKYHKNMLKSDVLILAHHGSKYSNSAAFLQKVAPQYAIASAGFANRYHFPNARVIKRCKRYNIRCLRTDNSGMINLQFSNNSGVKIDRYRYNRLNFWYDPVSKL